jgi:hypothetical protein
MRKPEPRWLRTIWISVLLWLLERATNDRFEERVDGALVTLVEWNVGQWEMLQLERWRANEP